MSTAAGEIQLRGHCQCCGREQAVDVYMAKHGYKVENGWFSGVCSGHHYRPIEQERTQADAIVAAIRKSVTALRAKAAGLRRGEIRPETITTDRTHLVDGKHVAIVIAFAAGSEHQQRAAIEREIYMTERRAEIGEREADAMQRLIEAVHGQPLRQVKREPGPAPIKIGEARVSHAQTLSCLYIDRGYVNWKIDNGRTGRMSLQAWRKLPLATGVPAPGPWRVACIPTRKGVIYGLERDIPGSGIAEPMRDIRGRELRFKTESAAAAKATGVPA